MDEISDVESVVSANANAGLLPPPVAPADTGLKPRSEMTQEELDAPIAPLSDAEAVVQHNANADTNARLNQQAKLRASAAAAAQDTPDQHAKILNLSAQTGISPDLVRGNEAKIADLARQKELQKQDDAAIVKDHPELAQWLSQPNNAGVAQADPPGAFKVLSQIAQRIANPDYDMAPDAGTLPPGYFYADGEIIHPNPGGLADHFKTPDEMQAHLRENDQHDLADTAFLLSQRGAYNHLSQYGAADFVAGLEEGGVSKVRFVQSVAKKLGLYQGDLSASSETGDYLDKNSEIDDQGNPRTGADAFFGELKRGAGNLVASLPEMVLGGPLGKLVGTFATAKKIEALASPFVAARAAAWIAPKAATAVEVGAAMQPLAIESAVNAADEHGAGYGAVDWAINSIIPGAFGHVGVAKAILGKVEEQTVGEKAIAQVLKQFGWQGGIAATQTVASSVLNYASGVDPDALKPEKLINAVGASTILGGLMGAAFAIPGTFGMKFAAQRLDDVKAMEHADKLQMLGAHLKESEANAKAPEAVGQLVNDIAQGKPVFMQPEEIIKHFAAQDQNAADQMKKMGLGDAFTQASNAKQVMAIPLKDFATMLSKAKDGTLLVGAARSSPEAPSAIEAAERIKNTRQTIDDAKKAAALVEASNKIRPGNEDISGESIGKDLKEQFKAIGRSDVEAGTIGKVAQKIFTNISDMFNTERLKRNLGAVTPYGIFKEFALQIKRGLPDVLAKAKAGGKLDAVINNLRAEGPKTKTDAELHAALQKIGVDVHAMKNSQIHAKLAQFTRDTAAAAGGAKASRTLHSKYDPVADKAGATAAEAKYGKARIAEELGKTLLEAKNMKVVQAGHVPYGAGVNVKRTVIYRDPSMETKLKLSGGKVVPAMEPTKVHEITESRLMDEGMTYDEAHDLANAVERASLRQAGYSEAEIDEYETKLKPDLRKSYEKKGEVPADLDPRPYAAENELSKIQKPGEGTPVTLNSGARGSFSIGHDLASVITLMQSANKTTALHEMGHFFLEVMRVMSSREDAPQALKDDFQKIMDWSGYGSAENMEAMKQEKATLQAEIGDKTPTDAQKAKLDELSKPHETFARGFEKYLFEGVAPERGLRSAFNRIKKWMMSVYKDIKNITVNGDEVKLNPEIRQVFDRLFASEAETRVARDRFGDALKASINLQKFMTVDEAAKHDELRGEVERLQEEALQKKLLAVQKMKESEPYKADLEKTKAEVTEAVAKEPAYSAIDRLQSDEIKLDRKAVEGMLTPEQMADLPGPGAKKNAGKPIFGAEGLDPDEAAIRLGFKSGHELLDALMKADDRQAHIDRAVDEAMKVKHPDPMENPDLMESDADAAVHDPDLRGQLMDHEAKVLERLFNSIDQKPLIADTEAKRHAEAWLYGRSKDKGIFWADKEAIEHLKKLAEEAGTAELPEGVLEAQTKEAGGTEWRKIYRLAAALKINGTPLYKLRLGGLSNVYRKAERDAAIAYAKAVDGKDWKSALAAKRLQMYNAELFRAARDARTQVAKDKAKINKLAQSESVRKEIRKTGDISWAVNDSRGLRVALHNESNRPAGSDPSAENRAREHAAKIGGDVEVVSPYMEQIDKLLGRFEGIKTKGVSQNVPSIKDFLADEAEQNRYATVAEWLQDDSARVPVSQMTVRELHDVRVAAESLEKMALDKNQMYIDGQKVDKRIIINKMLWGDVGDEVAQKLMDHYNNTGEAGVHLDKDGNKVRVEHNGLIANSTKFKGWLGKFGDWLNKYGAELLAMPSIARDMDGHKFGAMQKYIIHPLREAAREGHKLFFHLSDMMTEATLKWGKHNSFGAWREKPLPDGIVWKQVFTQGPDVVLKKGLSLREKLVLIAHAGNPEGRARLEDCHGLKGEHIQAIFDTLDANDIAYLNRMTDVHNEYWDKLAANSLKHNGAVPPKVEAIPIVGRNGTYKGGYQRIYYNDYTASKDEMAATTLSGADVRRPQGPTLGAEKDRVKRVFNRRLSLDMLDWVRAADELAHSLSHRDALLNNYKLLNSLDVKNALNKYYGEPVYKAFMDAHQNIAVGGKQSVGFVAKGPQYIINNGTFGAWGLNPVFAALHATQVPPIMAKLGPIRALQGMMHAFSSPHDEPSLRFRADGRGREVVGKIPVGSDAWRVYEKVNLFLVQKMAWDTMDQTAYHASLSKSAAEGRTLAEAKNIAEQAVAELGGAKDIMDKPSITGHLGAPLKIFMNRMLFDFANYNSMRQSANRVAFGIKTRSAGDVLKGAGAFATTVIGNGLMWTLLQDLFWHKDMKKELEKWESPGEAAFELLSATATSLLRTVPIIRDMLGGLFEKKGDTITGTGTITHTEQAVNYFTQTKAAHRTVTKDLKHGADLLGWLIPMPTRQFDNTVDGIEYNKTHSQDLWHQIWNDAAGPPKKK